LRSLWNGGRKNNNKKADDDGPRDDEAVLAPAVMGGPPKEPGCYVQLPSRCPKHASAKPRSWRHDAWAEEGPALGAGVREAEGGVGQLVRRLRREDALRARGARRRPRGVLARAVRLRPRRASADIRAAADVRGRRARGGAGHGAVVEGRVLRDNAPAAGVRAHPGGDRPGGDGPSSVHKYPTTPGCYVRMPSGCPNHPSQKTHWKHDVYAEERHRARERYGKCKDRR
ncbi:unnamed protein product, partial [Prorocentrum cordatum]